MMKSPGYAESDELRVISTAQIGQEVREEVRHRNIGFVADRIETDEAPFEFEQVE